MSYDVKPMALALVAEVENRTSRVVTFQMSRAPWSENGLRVVVVRLSDWQVLPRNSFDADDFMLKVTLQPGERRKGAFLLHYVVRDVRRALRESDLLVLWYWKPPPLDGSDEPAALHGSVLLPRQ